MNNKLLKLAGFITGLFLLPSLAWAQMLQMRYYSPTNRNELITCAKSLPDGSAILGGYIYDLSGSMATHMDMILMRVDAAGAIVWQKQFGDPNGGDDILKQLIITQNGDIVVVGLIGRSSVYQNNTAAILRFTSGGGLIWQNLVRETTNTTEGDEFEDVAELTNGTLLAVGSRKAAPSVSSSMICSFTGAGVLNYIEAYDRSGSDGFLGVCANGNKAVITGWWDGQQYKDSRVLMYQPGTTSGTIIWDKSYNISGASNGGGALVSDGFHKPYIRGQHVVINGHAAQTWGPTPSVQAFFECDLSNGANPAWRTLVNTGKNYANNTAFYPVDDQRFFVSQNPATVFQDALAWGSGVFANAVVSQVQPFQITGQVTASREFNLPGDQAIFSIDMQGSNLYMAGCTNAAAGGVTDNDVYYVVSKSNLQNPDQTCDLRDVNITIGNPTPLAQTPPETVAQYINKQPYPLTFSDPKLVADKICGEPVDPPTDCSSQCYWRVDGNNFINPSNVLGTVNSEDIRFVTSNTQRAVLERQYGRFGINTPGPTARLHVNCAPADRQLSDVRFENLDYGRGEVLVIDPQGYVYRSSQLQARPGSSGVTTDSLIGIIGALQKDVAYLMERNNILSGAGIATDLSLYPNPATNTVEIEIKNNPSVRQATIQVMDVSGKTVMNTPAAFGENRKAQLNTSSLAPGTLHYQASEWRQAYRSTKLGNSEVVLFSAKVKMMPCLTAGHHLFFIERLNRLMLKAYSHTQYPSLCQLISDGPFSTHEGGAISFDRRRTSMKSELYNVSPVSNCGSC